MKYVVLRDICGFGRRSSAHIFAQILHVSEKKMHYCSSFPDQRIKGEINRKERKCMGDCGTPITTTTITIIYSDDYDTRKFI